MIQTFWIVLKTIDSTLTRTVSHMKFFLSSGTCAQLSILIGIVFHARLPTMVARWLPFSPNACPLWLYLIVSLTPSLFLLLLFFYQLLHVGYASTLLFFLCWIFWWCELLICSFVRWWWVTHNGVWTYSNQLSKKISK